MNTEFKVNLERKLHSYSEWVKGFAFTSCRLVHYCGVDKPNAKNVPLENVSNEIEGCLSEGFLVEWFADDNRLFICVQEPGCPIPNKEKVISEEAIEDVDEILRKAGFDENA